jgi:glutamate-1-semialdehyde 2,1-aminomutase
MWPNHDSASYAAYQRSLKVMPGGVTRLAPWQDPYPIYARSGSGARITDLDGSVFVDYINNFASLIHGHAHPRIVEAVCKQVALGTAFTMPTEIELSLAELLCERIPSFDQIRFCNSGTEAVMMAIKAARAFTRRSKIVKIEGAYHGMYDYAEVSLDSSPKNWGNDPNAVAYATGTPQGVVDDVIVIPFNQPAAAARIITANGPAIAAVLIDIMPSYTGMVPATAEYLNAIVTSAKAVGALVVLDEVVSFRLGYEGGQGIFDLSPDMTTLAKIIGGGFPVGAIAGKAEVMAVFDHRKGKPLMPSSGTFSANPVSMTAGFTTMTMLTRELFASLNELGDYARQQIARAVSASGYSAQVTGLGSIFKLHMHNRPVSDYRSAYATESESRAMLWLQQRLLKHGYLISNRAMGFLSTAMTRSEVDGLAAAFAEELKVLNRTGVPA